MIVPTDHLRLVGISCSHLDPPTDLWRKICTSRHYTSMIRRLEICKGYEYDEYLYRRPYPLWRINRHARMSSVLTNSRPVMVTSSPQEFFFQSLPLMDGLKSFTILNPDSAVYFNVDVLLHHISENFSNSLEILHIYYTFHDLTTYRLSARSLDLHCVSNAYLLNPN